MFRDLYFKITSFFTLRYYGAEVTDNVNSNITAIRYKAQ